MAFVVALGYRYEVQLGKMLDEKRITGEHLRPYLHEKRTYRASEYHRPSGYGFQR